MLNIVAGSEHAAVFRQVVQPWCREQKLSCTMTELGSVDQARLLDAGEAPYDGFWFASSVFQQLGDTGHRLQQAQPMFSTPLVFAGPRSELEALGFTGRDVGIEEILAAAEAKKTTVWMTNPTQSNSGATVLLAFLNYFAGNGPGVPLTRAQLDSEQVRTGITRFTRAFARTPPSTGLLMDECLAAPQQCKTMFTYENLVIERNQELVRAGKEPLHVIYPKAYWRFRTPRWASYRTATMRRSSATSASCRTSCSRPIRSSGWSGWGGGRSPVSGCPCPTHRGKSSIPPGEFARRSPSSRSRIRPPR